MTGIWRDVLGRGWEVVAAGVVLLVMIAIWTQPREYSCAPADLEDETDEGAEWDRARDRDIDERNGVS